jgi:hypothetical protein
VFVAIQGYTGSYATAFGIIGVLGVLGTLALMNARRLSPSAAAIPS